MCPITAKKAVEIPVQPYSGKIVTSEIETSEKDGKPVQYVVMTVQTDAEVEGWDGRFRLSTPAYLTQNSGLGKLLRRLKVNFTFGQEFDEHSLEGLTVQFDTIRNGNFVNPVMDSVRLG